MGGLIVRETLLRYGAELWPRLGRIAARVGKAKGKVVALAESPA
jgi:hypothetical protein